MNESTKDMMFSFIPLSGWLVSLNAEPFWQYVGVLNLAFALLMMVAAVTSQVKEIRASRPEVE